MSRTVERIEQELALLDQAIAALAQEFHNTYSQYLTAFGQAVRQQLILASYHLCTHGYPERFLNLSLNQRQQLQRSLRQLAKTAQTQLLDRLQSVEASKASFDAALLGPIDSLQDQLGGEFAIEEIAIGNVELPADLPFDSSIDLSADLSADLFNVSLDEPSNEQSVELSEPELSEPELSESGTTESELTEPELTEPELTEPGATEPGSLPELELAEAPLELTSIDSAQVEELPIDSAHPDPRPTHPKDLVYWQEQLEEGVVEELQDLSHAANRLLQQAEILPGRLPEPVLEVAAKADIASESAVSPPNLLNLLIETEDEDEKESTMTQLMAIRLRLSEIEFSDTASTILRSKIRDLSTRLNKLSREYQRKQKERSVAQAEAAWRSSWYED